jgi:hypothetical protein
MFSTHFRGGVPQVRALVEIHFLDGVHFESESKLSQLEAFPFRPNGSIERILPPKADN